MDVGRLKVISLARTARTDMLGAMTSLPNGVALSRAPLGIPLVVAHDFASASQVLIADADSYRKPWIIRKIIEDGLGENLFTLDGDAWLARRQPCAPVFGVSQMDSLTATMMSTANEVASSWQPGQIDIQAAMTDLTMQIALRALLGTDDDTAEVAAAAQRDFEEILDWISFRFNRPTSLPAFAPTARNRRLHDAKSNLQSAIRKLIAHRKTNESQSLDILSQLVMAQQTGSHAMSDDAIVDECIGFMFAGHETTASTLSWALYELALRPDLQDALAAEAALIGSSDDVGAGINDMVQTSAVVEETLRLYPAGISVARSAKRTTHIGSERIRKGTMVLIPVYSIQRSAEVWDNPNTFDPSRAYTGNGDGFLPFGLGPRRCLGARFARTELRVALAHICSTWSLTYDQPSPPTPIVAPSLRAEGELPITLARRS